MCMFFLHKKKNIMLKQLASSPKRNTILKMLRNSILSHHNRKQTTGEGNGALLPFSQHCLSAKYF